MSDAHAHTLEDFQTGDRWVHIKDRARRWWAGELPGPLVALYLTGAPTDRDEPDLMVEYFTARYDFSVPPDAIVDRWEYNLSALRYMGDTFPHAWANFGPGAVAAFLGAVVESRFDTVWYGAPDDRDITDVDFTYDADNVWFRRVCDLSRGAADRWQGTVQICTADLGGTLDILSTFRPSDKLPMDLIRHQNDVHRLTEQIHTLWWRYFDEITDTVRGANPGYSTWAKIYSDDPHYMLQSDFCYMISPAMFEEFVKPELAASCKRLPNAFYHLDGPGQLRHLDSLLEIEELKGVQWIPGAGQPDMDAWPEVYRKIRDAGKLVQLFGEPKILDAVVEQVGSAEGLILVGTLTYYYRDEAVEFLRKYDAL